MTLRVHDGDLPDLDRFGPVVAVDSETMGLEPRRDRLCLVQLSTGDGSADLVRIAPGQTRAPNLERLLGDPGVVKLFHFARFDIGILFKTFGIVTAPVFCTKVASRLVRTYTDKHGLKELLKDLLGVEISKQQQTSDWGAAELTEAQLAYAASDVLHLHALKARMEVLLDREDRRELAEACFAFLPTRARLDILGWDGEDVLAHS